MGTKQRAHDARLRALDAFLESYEKEHGRISEIEVADARRWARAKAVVVRGDSSPNERR